MNDETIVVCICNPVDVGRLEGMKESLVVTPIMPRGQVIVMAKDDFLKMIDGKEVEIWNQH